MTLKTAVISAALIVSALVGNTGCSTATPEGAAGGAASCQPGAAYQCTCSDGVSLGSQTCSIDGSWLSACQCSGSLGNGLGVGGAGTTGSISGGSIGSSPLPCDVATILQEHCSLCHGATPAYTAPMSLVTWEDLTKPSVTDPNMPVYQKVIQRIQDVQRPMPQPPNPALAPEDIATLVSWANGGAPVGTSTTCNVTGTAGTGSVEGMAGSGGAAGTGAIAGEDECYDILAHANGDKTAPFNVPTTPDYYSAFNFAPPWGSDQVQVTRAISMIQNTAVVHHWILYSGGGADGSVAQGTGTHSGQFIVGWAPGAQDTVMPDDVGLQLPPGNFQLEIHYNAPSAGQTDMSGVRLCITKTPRPNTAATHPLGEEWLSPTAGAGSISGTCKPRGPFPITIITSSPHMHKKGTHMKTVINRANGTTEVLVDKPFDFNTQIAYDTPTQINQGDTLTTTCTYSGSARFGTGTSDEMCYNFVTAYPAGALAGASGYTGLSNNGNTCIQTGF